MHLDFLTRRFLISSNLFNKPIIVTGANGCIGSWVISILHKSNIPCIGIDFSGDKSRSKILIGNDYKKLIVEKCDITDFVSLKNTISKHDPCAIIHLAGLQVPFCFEKPSLGARVNVEGTINILEICKELNIKRLTYASSVASLGMPPAGPWKETLYGLYKQANEHSAYVFWSDWKVPSIGIRPNVVYGLARDQGVSSKNTLAILACALNKKFEIPYSGKYSWLYAGEAASAFIQAISNDIEGADVYNLNGDCKTIEESIKILKTLNNNSKITCSGNSFPFPPDLSDVPLIKKIGKYKKMSFREGIESTFKAFKILDEFGECPVLPN